MDALGNAVYVTPHYTLKAEHSISYTEKEVKAWGNTHLFYQKNLDSYDVQADFMQVQICNGALGTVKANGSLIIKTKDATIHGDRGIFIGNKAQVFGNVTISSERGNVFGNAATIDMKTSDALVDQLSGIVTDEKRK
jgi:hypothetical protein